MVREVGQKGVAGRRMSLRDDAPVVFDRKRRHAISACVQPPRKQTSVTGTCCWPGVWLASSSLDAAEKWASVSDTSATEKAK